MYFVKIYSVVIFSRKGYICITIQLFLPGINYPLMKLTNRIIVFTAFIILLFFLFFGTGFRRALDGDVLGYYMYLPSTFIYHNNKSLEKLPADRQIDPHLIICAQLMRANKTPLGYTQDQYTIGVAIMEAPFFLIAHGWEKASGLMANGYSTTYTNLITFGAVFYAILGLIIVYKILKKYFSETQALFSVLAIFYGTNFFWFTLFQAGMSHVPLFFLYALLIYVTILLHEKPRIVLFVIAGFCSGMITLIRPVDIICLLIPLLYNVYNKETFRRKIHFVTGNIGKILLAACVFFAVLIPQVVYWKIMTGQYVYYSYGAQTFNWLHPKIVEGLFFAHNGWLPYSPVMIFSLLGLILYKKLRTWNWCIWFILPLYIYIIYSWYCYNYINGYGSRPMIHLYPLLSLPLAAFIQWASQRKMFLKITFAALCLFLISVNVSYSLQQGKWLFFSDESNMVYNLQVLFRTQLRYNDLVTYDLAETQPDTNKLVKIGTLACENYEDSVSDRYVKDTMYGSKYVYYMADEEFPKKSILLFYDKNTFQGATWVKCSGKFMYPYPPDDAKHILVFDIQDTHWRGCQIENKIDILDGSCPPENIKLNHYRVNKWGYVSFFTKIPKNIEKGKAIKLFVASGHKRDIYIDDLCIELYK